MHSHHHTFAAGKQNKGQLSKILSSQDVLTLLEISSLLLEYALNSYANWKHGELWTPVKVSWTEEVSADPLTGVYAQSDYG